MEEARVGPTLERRTSAWIRSAIVGAALVLLTISFVRSSQGGQEEAQDQVGRVLAAAAVEKERPGCPRWEIAVTRADVGAGPELTCLPLGGDVVDGSHVDPLYGRIAADLIERVFRRPAPTPGSVTVICWSKPDWLTLTDAFRESGQMHPLRYWLGWVIRKRDVINLSYPVCKQLDSLTDRSSRPDLADTSAAVGTLAHETMHVAGIADEGIAECYAMQLTAVTALGLGADADYADQLRALYYEFNQMHRSGTEYDSPDCYDGGPLDLDPESRHWP
jgi:hypothetical protein